MDAFLSQVLGYVAVFFMLFFILQALTRGFILKYLSVKASRGTKLLVLIRGSFEDYIAVGVPSEGTVLFKDRSKEKKRVCLPKEGIFRFLGVAWCQIDEEKGAVVVKDFSTVPGFDPAKIQNLIVRALTRPPLTQKKDIIVYLGLGLIIILLIAVLVQIGAVKEAIPTVASVTGGNI